MQTETNDLLLFNQYAIDHMADMAYWLTSEGKIAYVNEAACRLLGYSREEFLEMSIMDIADNERTRNWNDHWQTLKKTDTLIFKSQHRSRSGNLVPVEVRVSYIAFGGKEFKCGFVRDITERVKADLELQQTELRYRMLFESAHDAIFIMQNDRFIECNTATLKMYGCRRDEIIGKTPFLFSPPRQPDGRSSVEKSKEKINLALAGQSQSFEWKHCRLDKSEFDAEVSLNRLELGGHLHLQAIVRDITDRKLAEEKISKLNETLEQRVLERTTQLVASNKELEAFCYSVSHDLRAPVRALNGFAKILARDYAHTLDEEANRLLDVIAGNARNMGVLIDDLLEFSRLGRQEMTLSGIDMTQMAGIVYNELCTAEDKSKTEFRLLQLPAAMGDPGMVRQVWINLVNNALKFSSKKHQRFIEIGSTQAEGVSCYYVRDNGTGFDMTYSDKLFGVFQRLHSIKDFEGSGVGLAIVQRIILRLGGRVWAEGKVGEGATFYFTLPGMKGNQ